MPNAERGPTFLLNGAPVGPQSRLSEAPHTAVCVRVCVRACVCVKVI